MLIGANFGAGTPTATLSLLKGSTEGLPTAGEKARETAHGLIQVYIRPDHKVMVVTAFFSALVEALRDTGIRRE